MVCLGPNDEDTTIIFKPRSRANKKTVGTGNLQVKLSSTECTPPDKEPTDLPAFNKEEEESPVDSTSSSSSVDLSCSNESFGKQIEADHKDTENDVTVNSVSSSKKHLFCLLLFCSL